MSVCTGFLLPPAATGLCGAGGWAVSWGGAGGWLWAAVQGAEEPLLLPSQLLGARALADGVTFSHLITTFSVTLSAPAKISKYLCTLLPISLYTVCNSSHASLTLAPFPSCFPFLSFLFFLGFCTSNVFYSVFLCLLFLVSFSPVSLFYSPTFFLCSTVAGMDIECCGKIE